MNNKTFELVQFKKGQKIHALDDRINKTYCLSSRNKDLTNLYYTNFGELKDIECQACKGAIKDREIKDSIEQWEFEQREKENKVLQSIRYLKDGESICDMCLESSNNTKVISLPLKGEITFCFLCRDVIGKQLI